VLCLREADEPQTVLLSAAELSAARSLPLCPVAGCAHAAGGSAGPFKRLRNLELHLRSHPGETPAPRSHIERRFFCPSPGCAFAQAAPDARCFPTESRLRSHWTRMHDAAASRSYPCAFCAAICCSQRDCTRHQQWCHVTKVCLCGFMGARTAFETHLKQGNLVGCHGLDEAQVEAQRAQRIPGMYAHLPPPQPKGRNARVSAPLAIEAPQQMAPQGGAG